MAAVAPQGAALLAKLLWVAQSQLTPNPAACHHGSITVLLLSRGQS